MDISSDVRKRQTDRQKMKIKRLAKSGRKNKHWVGKNWLKGLEVKKKERNKGTEKQRKNETKN